MGVFVTLLFVVLYLTLIVDWKDLMETIRLGGWATIGVYIVLIVLIIGVLNAPETVAVAPAMHH